LGLAKKGKVVARMSPQKIPGLSVFFPAYNDAGTIASMVVAARAAARQVTDDYELIVINDDSHDYTQEILNELAAVYPELRIIQHPQNLGYGGVLRDGFASATKPWVFYTDGDAQYNPMELSLLVDALQDGIQIVNGYKISRSDPLIRVIIGYLYNVVVKWAFSIRVRDVDCDFRLIDRSVFDTVHLVSNTGVICVEMIKKIQDAGFVFAEVPVHHYSRQYGVSQFFNWKRLLRVARQLSVLWWQLVFRKDAR
jgi:glycosyltransferase involved in cell wall biosynthesis